MTEWIERLRPRCGALVPAAIAFVEKHAPGEAAAFPRGRDGLARLARALDEWLDGGVDDDDERVVEGAGALLGLLIVDHVGAGAHEQRDGVHRLRLGAHGFFDPFGAIDAALDADDPRACLAARVREAEAEARGEGPIARVVAALERRLGAERPELAIVDRFACTVSLAGGIEIDLVPLVRATADQPIPAVEQAVAKLLRILPGGAGGPALEWSEVKSRLVPRLVGADFVARLGDLAKERGRLFLAPIGHDVRLALLVDHGERARYLREDELAAWSVSADDARSVAIANLAARSARARFGKLDTMHGPIVVARSGDGLDAARLLLPGLHDVLSPELGSPFVVAVPHRDTLLACPLHPPALVETLRARAQDDAARAPHRITPNLFVKTEGALLPY